MRASRALRPARQRPAIASAVHRLRSIDAIILIIPIAFTSFQNVRSGVPQTEINAGKRAGQTTSDKERILELERECRELRRANEIIRKAAAFFAQAELEPNGNTNFLKVQLSQSN